MHRSLLVLAILLPSCTSAAVDPAAERAAIMEADRAFARETAARGVEGWLDYHLEDAHNVLSSGPVVVGHAAIRERMTASLADTTQFFAWEPVFAEVAADGSLGFTYGDWSTTDGATDSVTSKGRYLTVWKKLNGEWKVTADIGNDAR